MILTVVHTFLKFHSVIEQYYTENPALTTLTAIKLIHDFLLDILLLY